jgi:hypothetical protein
MIIYPTVYGGDSNNLTKLGFSPNDFTENLIITESHHLWDYVYKNFLTVSTVSNLLI